MKQPVLLAAALVSGLVASPSAKAQNTVPAAFAGTWLPDGTAPSPWSPDAKPNPALVKARLHFARRALRSASLFGCSPARYELINMEPTDLFEGNLPEGKQADEAKRLGFATKIETIRVLCPNAAFDFHRTGDGRLKIAIDNVIYTFRRK